MKKLVILLIVAAAIVLKTEAAVAAPLAKQLVELESHIKWSAVDNAWKKIRPGWVATTTDCEEPACVAAQLLELETSNMSDGKRWTDPGEQSATDGSPGSRGISGS